MTDDTDDKVSKIGPTMSPPIELIVNNEHAKCYHRSYVIDAGPRSVTCATCGAIVDPFDALLHLSHERHNEALNRTHRKHEIRELEQRLEIIKQMVQRIKAEARKLGVPLSLVNHWDTAKLGEVLGVDKELLERAKVVDAHWARRRKVVAKPRLVKGQR